MKFRSTLCSTLCIASVVAVLAIGASAQESRPRYVPQPESKPTNSQAPAPTVRKTVLASPVAAPQQQRSTLTNQIVVVGQKQPAQPLVQKTSSTQPVNNSILNTANTGRLIYSQNFNDRLYSSIQSKLGIPYLYGSMGPNRYDCSSFVWKVFQEAGIGFTRTSARSMWSEFEPVYGDERFKFGTLVFFNNLGHVGIVADENGFYQASSSKGITYSPFAGYWSKRIVGYRRIPADYGFKK